MHKPMIVVGLGEMGCVFARALLRNSISIVPVNRTDSIDDIAQSYPDPAGVLVSVNENDLHPVLHALPNTWKTRLVLLQNELLPMDWQQHAIESPTIISVWFEKKPGQDYKIIIPSPIFGPLANDIITSLSKINIPCRLVTSSEQMINELVCKNTYILTTNIAGLLVGGTVAELWQSHRDLAQGIAGEVIEIQEWLTNKRIDRELIVKGMVEAFEGDLQHRCMGRSSKQRLIRALNNADAAGLPVPKLRQILTKVK